MEDYRIEMERILEPLAGSLGDHYTRYKNHSLRVFELSLLLHSGDLPLEDVQNLFIASAFNSLHVWSGESGSDWELRIVPLIEYLANIQQLDKTNEICHLIGITSKYVPFDSKPCLLQETFRKAYWIDITKGTRTFSLSRSNYKRLIRKYPSRGFHWLLRTRTHDLADTDARVHGAFAR